MTPPPLAPTCTELQFGIGPIRPHPPTELLQQDSRTTTSVTLLPAGAETKALSLNFGLANRLHARWAVSVSPSHAGAHHAQRLGILVPNLDRRDFCPAHGPRCGRPEHQVGFFENTTVLS